MTATLPRRRDGDAEPARDRIPGEAGMWIFILGDMVVFAVCFGVLAATDARDPAGYAAAAGALHLGLGALNTVVLVTGSLTMAMAVQAARRGRPRRSAGLVAATMAGGVIFVLVKALEYADLLADGHTARSAPFFLYFFCFTGLHLLHVLIGLVVLGGVRRIVRRPAPSAHDLALVESGAGYWHMVDLLWLVLFALLYLLA